MSRMHKIVELEIYWHEHNRGGTIVSKVIQGYGELVLCVAI